MATSASTAIRKRQQIAKANRMMFLWVAGASAVVGIAAVLGITLYNKMEFNNEIITEQGKTLSTLRENNRVVGTNEEPGELLQNAATLNTNAALLSSRSEEADQALQPILDALPSQANTAALGSSLQNVLLKVDEVTIDTLSFDGVASGANLASPLTASALPITFSFTASSNDINRFFELLAQLEKSIRPIKINTLQIEVGNSSVSLVVKAESYYQPPVSIRLGEKTLPEAKR